MTHRLVADIGGTNSRLALYDEGKSRLGSLQTFKNEEFGGFEQVLDQWFAGLDGPKPGRGCIAVAAPPGGDEVEMVNIDWRFSCNALADRFGLNKLTRINDFEANAHALPYLRTDELITLHAGRHSGMSSKLATLGPGTGLGGATVQNMGGTWYASACEPGHLGLSPANERELALFGSLLEQVDDIYAELLVSGQGLVTLYLALARLDGRAPIHADPAAISTAALEGEPDAAEALGMFCALLGSVCGDFILANGAYGGLYLAGGIVPRILPFLQQSDFHQRLVAKGAMRDILMAVPVYSISAAHPALLGAAHLPM